MTQEALKLALEALENLRPEGYWNKAITAIKEALAQTQEPVVYQCPRCATSMQVDLTAKAALAQTQEPVAWLSTDSIGERHLCFDKPLDNDPVQPLYTSPPQRTQVDLTDEEVFGLFGRFTAMTGKSWLDLYRMTEAKLKEKNT